jgi:hypothetical protein
MSKNTKKVDTSEAINIIIMERKCALSLDTAWRIIKTFFYESYIIQIRVAMCVETRQPPMRMMSMSCMYVFLVLVLF